MSLRDLPRQIDRDDEMPVEIEYEFDEDAAGLHAYPTLYYDPIRFPEPADVGRLEWEMRSRSPADHGRDWDIQAVTPDSLKRWSPFPDGKTERRFLARGYVSNCEDLPTTKGTPTYTVQQQESNEGFADPYLENPMLGADPAGYGFGAAIMHAPKLAGPGVRGIPSMLGGGAPGGLMPGVGSGLSGFGLGGAQASGASAFPMQALFDTDKIDAAKSSLAGLKAELAGVEAQINGLKASGEAAFSPDLSGLESKKAELEGLIDGTEQKLRGLGAITVAPTVDASSIKAANADVLTLLGNLGRVGSAADGARAKVAALGTAQASAQAAAAGAARTGAVARARARQNSLTDVG